MQNDEQSYERDFGPPPPEKKKLQVDFSAVKPVYLAVGGATLLAFLGAFAFLSGEPDLEADVASAIDNQSPGSTPPLEASIPAPTQLQELTDALPTTPPAASDTPVALGEVVGDAPTMPEMEAAEAGALLNASVPDDASADEPGTAQMAQTDAALLVANINDQSAEIADARQAEKPARIPSPIPRPGWIVALANAQANQPDEDDATAPNSAPNAELATNDLAAEGTTAATSKPQTANAQIAGFNDCQTCPELVMIEAGRFEMGSPGDEPGRYGYEGPQRPVSIKQFAIAAREVSFDEWDACVAENACIARPDSDRGWGRGSRPVLDVSWNDAQDYVAWISKKTGKRYRLPSEAEWEYVARAGTQQAYWWGAKFDGSKVETGKTVSAGNGIANPFGVFHMNDNAREWVEDCYQSSYSRAPSDGSAVSAENCSARVVRGGHWSSAPADMRSANRARIAQHLRSYYMGFRVARDP